MKFTIFGANGFIGSHLVEAISSLGAKCYKPDRGDPTVFRHNLGHVIYAIGLTSDFRKRSYDTVRAHVSHLVDLLERIDCESFLYLSSTRVYLKSRLAEEETPLWVNPSDPDDLYNLSKLLGESICLSSPRPEVRITRLSNVYGTDLSSTNFLTSLIRDAVEKKKIVLKTGIASEKDYIGIQDVVDILPRIARSGRHRLYNVASGFNVSHERLLRKIQGVTECRLETDGQAETVVFPRIEITRIQDEFDFSPGMLLPKLRSLVDQYKLRGIRANDIH